MMPFNVKSTSLIVTMLAASSSAVLAQTVEKRPNFLFISIDDLRLQTGAYGQDYMITPNLDALAADGRLFFQQYVQVPTSGASRACMLTGQPIRSEEETSNEIFSQSLIGTREGEDPETFIHHLRRNGYYTVGMGKISHHGNGHSVYKGVSQARELPFSWDRYVADPKWIWKGDDILHAYADGDTRNSTDRPAFESKDVPDESYPDGRLANLALAELDLIAQKGEPFFMAVGFYKPHLPFSAPLKYWNMYSDEDIDLAPNKTWPEGVAEELMYDSGEFYQQYTHPQKGGMGVVLEDDYARDVKHGYYAAVTYTDTQVGKVISKLKELGLYDNTIIIVWGDHGWSLGDNTIWGKHTTFNRALNSAFMVKTPNMAAAGEPSHGLVATIDIYPTICELAGIPVPEEVEGVSIVPMLEDPKAEVRDEVYSYWYHRISIKTERFRFSLYDKDGTRATMLFDHQNDPDETVNVADKFPEVVAELTQKIKDKNRGYLPNL